MACLYPGGIDWSDRPFRLKMLNLTSSVVRNYVIKAVRQALCSPRSDWTSNTAKGLCITIHCPNHLLRTKFVKSGTTKRVLCSDTLITILHDGNARWSYLGAWLVAQNLFNFFQDFGCQFRNDLDSFEVIKDLCRFRSTEDDSARRRVSCNPCESQLGGIASQF